MPKKTSSQRRIVVRAPSPDPRLVQARRLDQLADHNLHLGFHLAAERLARQAAELREQLH